MYSSYWKPNDGRDSNVPTDHEALHRDEATHKAMQSDETELRPLDLETIMSSKAAVKFWYLHRPKTMAYVHKNATKMQSVGRAFAVRRLRKQHGAEYMAALARKDQLRRDDDSLKELTDEERAAKELDDAAYDARVEESRRLRREQIEAERRAEEELRMKMAADASERRRIEEERKAAALAAMEEERIRKEAEAEEERLRQEEEAARLEELRLLEEEERRRQEEEAARLEEEKRLAALEAARLAEEEAIRVEEERQAAVEAARLEAEAAARREEQERLAEEARLREEEEERLRIEEEERLAEEERIRREEEEAAFLAAQAREEEERRAHEAMEARIREEKEREEAKNRERKLAEAALAAKAAEEKAERAIRERIQKEKDDKYEQSLSKDVPVRVHQRGPGRVVSYDKERETYAVKLERTAGGRLITVPSEDVHLDDDRILSPRTKVDTPFGTGEVVGLDPHVGCYAINTEVGASDDEQCLAFVQIKDVTVHVEEEEERAIVEDASLPIPSEIGLVSARIVDSRIVNRTGNKFIQYKLEIRTTNYGTVYCWKRYSTFRSLCDRLIKENGMKRRDIPELPPRHLVGNFSQKTVGERAEKLNLFLNAAARAEHLQWGIRVDDQIAVYKRRNKRVTQPSSQANNRNSRSIFSRRR